MALLDTFLRPSMLGYGAKKDVRDLGSHSASASSP